MDRKNVELKALDGHETNWIRRMGLAGFSFFFIKGMLWLIVPLIARAALAG